MWKQWTKRARWVLIGGVVSLLGGCALDPAGNPTIDVQALGAKTLSTIDTPRGPMVLRETRDQQGHPLFQLKFLNSYQLMNFPNGTRLVQFNETKTIAGASFVVFEKTSASCAHDYMVLIVTPRSVLPFRPQTDCHSDLKFFQRGDEWVALQYQPRLHHWFIKAQNVDMNPSIWEGTPDYDFLSSVPGAPIPLGLQPPKPVEQAKPANGRPNSVAKTRASGGKPASADATTSAPKPELLKSIPISAAPPPSSPGKPARQPSSNEAIPLNLGDFE